MCYRCGKVQWRDFGLNAGGIKADGCDYEVVDVWTLPQTGQCGKALLAIFKMSKRGEFLLKGGMSKRGVALKGGILVNTRGRFLKIWAELLLKTTLTQKMYRMGGGS